ncbi:hypothetical protein AAVH_09940 [Aphelenchoides avenae]|nr:hypothetical protein AAVH_09940 [Aphelenchus avenae]
MTIFLRSVLRRLHRQSTSTSENEASTPKRKCNSIASVAPVSEQECKTCAKPYNLASSLPMVYPCGHSTCHECATKIWLRAKAFQCPFCRVCAHKVSVSSLSGPMPTTKASIVAARDLARSSSTRSDSSTSSDLLEEYEDPVYPASLAHLVEEFPHITRTSYLHDRTMSC